MHNVDMNVAMAKRCNMQNIFSDFNKYNVISTAVNVDEMGAEFSTREESV
jgi:hypothetical protein